MSFYYRKLLTLNLTHGYYSGDGMTEDFTIKPTTATAEDLDANGLLFRNTDLGIIVFYRARNNSGSIDPVRPATGMKDGTRFTFLLQLDNPYFYNFTDLPMTKSPRNSVYLYNSAAGVKTPDGGNTYTESIAFPAVTEVEFKAPVFAHTYTLTGNPPIGVLRLSGPDGNVIEDVASDKNDNDEYVAYFDLTRFPGGKYSLQRINDGTPEGSAVEFYHDPEVNPGITFGVIEIVKDVSWEEIQAHNSALNTNDGIRYDVAFANREDQWVYQVVFKYTEIPADLADVVIEETFVAIPGNRYHDDALTDQFFFKRDASATTFNGIDSLVFRSVDNSDVAKDYPLYQEAKNNLNLKIEGATVYAGLPNPDYKNGKTEVIVYV